MLHTQALAASESADNIIRKGIQEKAAEHAVHVHYLPAADTAAGLLEIQQRLK